ncbi:hypothetical protein CMU45_02680 [Elizabethkingia anophelis]|nr:hypothetical protein [Elizabethkingia anophelis]
MTKSKNVKNEVPFISGMDFGNKNSSAITVIWINESYHLSEDVLDQIDIRKKTKTNNGKKRKHTPYKNI